MSSKKTSERQSELKKLETQAKEYLEGWQRAKADYSNLKKDVAQEREQFARFARINWVMQLLPLYNNFQTAFAHLPEELNDNEWVKGILHVKDQFSAVLKDLKIEKIKTKHNKFNAAQHEAVSRENNAGSEAGVILREVEPGYLLDGEVLVPAKVVVAE